MKYFEIADTHLSKDTIELNMEVHRKVIRLCKEKGVGMVVHDGDFFTSRPGQTQQVLKAALDIEKMYQENQIKMYVIAGNHDKNDQELEYSYLVIFESSKWIIPIENEFHIDFNEVGMYFLPYFPESGTYKKRLEKLASLVDNTKLSILHTHVAVDGVQNNGGGYVQNTFEARNFKNFDRVHIGHYHDRQKLDFRIEYVGSTHQANFGEEEGYKGAHLITINGDTITKETFSLNTPVYITHSINYSDKKDMVVWVNEMHKSLEDDRAKLRVKVHGPNEKLLSVKWSEVDPSVKVELVSDEIKKIEETDRLKTSYNIEDIKEGFDSFARSKKVSKSVLELSKTLMK